MQDDTQRTEAVAPSAPGAPPPSPPQPVPTQEGSRQAGQAALQPSTPPPASQPPAVPAAENGGVEPGGFGTLGLAPDRTESLREAIRNDALREPLPFHTDLDTSLPYGYDQHEPIYLPLALSVGAGFKFGCGFMLAVGISLFGLFLAASVIFFVAALAGVPLPGATP